MMNFYSKLIFFMTLISGTLIAISSSSWIGMWMGLELNLLSFIPLMIDTKNLISTESAIKYFLVQTFASLIFLFSIILYIIKFNSFFFMTKFTENIIINSTMMLKLGAAPFHFWFPNIISGLSWNNSLILLTWQKFAPLMIISYSTCNFIIIIFIVLSAFIGSISGLNQTSLQKILVFSSINHISWLLTAMFYNNNLWTFYFFIYIFMNFSIIFLFKNFNLFHINQIFFNNNNKSLMKFCLMINFLSLGGLPPFTGFFPKWMIIENMIKSNNLFMIFFMVMMTLITLYFYARTTFSAFTFLYPSFKWINKMPIKLNFLSLNLIFNFLMMTALFMLLINNYFIY